jgi:uncharacterized membrane protein (DUF373 family)
MGAPDETTARSLGGPVAAGGREGRDVARRQSPRLPLLVIAQLEDIVHYVIAVLLLGVAGYVIVRTVAEFVSGGGSFATRVTSTINDVLFVIIVLELLRTVLDHFDSADLQLEPFLIIGIISAVRHILTIGARLTLVGEGTGPSFTRSQIELGVEAGVVLALAVGLLLVRTWAKRS